MKLDMMGIWSVVVFAVPLSSLAEPEVPGAFSDEIGRIVRDEKMTLQEALPVEVAGAGQWLVVTFKATAGRPGISLSSLIVLRPGSPPTVAYREESFGMHLAPIEMGTQSGTDINGDGFPDVLALTDPGGSGVGTTRYSILTLTPQRVRVTYSGPLWKTIDLDGDGFVDLIEISERDAGLAGVAFTALKWRADRYVRSPALERRTSFKIATSPPRPIALPPKSRSGRGTAGEGGELSSREPTTRTGKKAFPDALGPPLAWSEFGVTINLKEDPAGRSLTTFPNGAYNKCMTYVGVCSTIVQVCCMDIDGKGPMEAQCSQTEDQPATAGQWQSWKASCCREQQSNKLGKALHLR